MKVVYLSVLCGSLKYPILCTNKCLEMSGLVQHRGEDQDLRGLLHGRLLEGPLRHPFGYWGT